MIPNGVGSQNALTNGVNAVGILTNPGGGNAGQEQFDNVFYNGPTTQTDKAGWLARITDAGNWSGDDSGAGATSIGVSSGSNLSMDDPAPVIDGVPAQLNFTEDNDAPLDLSGMTISDSNLGGGDILVEIQASSGTFGMAATGGIALSLTGNGTSTIGITGSLADVHTYLSTPTNIRYTPQADLNGAGAATITITATDQENPGEGSTISTPIAIDISAVNDAPTATNLTQSKTATEGGSAVALDDIVVTDVDIGDTITATLTLSDPGAGTLSTGTYGSATSTFNAGTGIWTVEGSVADVNAALAAVALTPSADNDQNFTITTQIRDAAGTGPTNGTISVAISSSNEAPVVTTSGGSAAATEGSPVVVDSGMTLSDPDNTTMASATVSITGNFQSGEDLLVFTNDGATMGDISADYAPATGVLTLTSDGATATLAQWQAALRSVAYENSSQNPAEADRTISFVVNDGIDDSSAATKTVTVTAVNDAPEVTAPGTIAVTGGTATPLTGISFVDVDAESASVTVTLSVPDGNLAAISGAGVAVSGTPTALILTGTVGDINAFVAASNVSFTPAPGATGDVTLSVLIDDGGNTGSGGAQMDSGAVTLSIASPPVVTIGGGAPAYTEDGTPAAVAPNLMISAPDSPDIAGATVTITDLVADDSLDFTNQNGITGSYNAGTGVLTLTGTASVADYQAALQSITYSSTNDNPATGAGNDDRIIEFRVSDGTLESAAGTNQSVAVENANDAPVLDPGASPELAGIADDAGTPVNGSTVGSTLASTLLGGVSDVDDGAVQGMAIVGASALGTLWYSLNGGLTWNLAPSLSDTNALLLQPDARLYFQPNAGSTGTIADAVTFRAWDQTAGSNGGTVDTASNGGATAFSSATDTVSITLAGDGPTVTAANISISGATGTGGAFKIGDTVTATWDNSADGDNNPGVAIVTITFGAFGGSTASATVDSDGIWTATYTIVAGGIDGINRNVSVTATNADGSDTAVGTANATVDSIAPTVTDANISISGASGTGGEYKIGDTVTATWNDTAGGDNNSDTISGVTVDFSAFGGGSTVAATNVGGVWTATYLLAADVIDTTGLNVAVTATDNAGNTTTTADATDATADLVRPLVASVAVPPDGTYVKDDTLTFTVVLDDVVDITGGSPRLAIDLNTGGRVYANYVSGSGTDTLTFDLVVSAGQVDDDGIEIASLDANGARITDAVGNAADLTLQNVADTSRVLFDAPAPGGGDGDDDDDDDDGGIKPITPTADNVIIATPSPDGTPVTVIGIDGIDEVHIAGSVILGEGLEHAVIGGTGDYTVQGNDLDNVIYGNVGNTTIFASAGRDFIDGGYGANTVVFDGPSSGFSVRIANGVAEVTNLATGDVTTIANVATLQFSDGDQPLFATGHAMVSGFYEAFLGRELDEAGFEFWMGESAGGLGPFEMVRYFINSPEFLERTESLTSTELVEWLYDEFLGREQDTAGQAYWIDAIENGMSYGEVAANFVFSQEVGIRIDELLDRNDWLNIV